MQIEAEEVRRKRDKFFRLLKNNESLEGDENGDIHVLGERFNIMGADYFMTEILETLSELYAQGAGGILKNTGEDYGEELCKTIDLEEDASKSLGMFLGFLKFLGYSNILFEDKRFIVEHSPTAESHKDSEYESKKTCYFLAGVLESIVDEVSDEEKVVEEKKCLADGDQKCVFKVSS